MVLMQGENKEVQYIPYYPLQQPQPLWQWQPQYAPIVTYYNGTGKEISNGGLVSMSIAR